MSSERLLRRHRRAAARRCREFRKTLQPCQKALLASVRDMHRLRLGSLEWWVACNPGAVADFRRQRDQWMVDRLSRENHRLLLTRFHSDELLTPGTPST